MAVVTKVAFSPKGVNVPEPRTVLGEAEDMVYGGTREKAYGHPKIAYSKVAGLWSAYLHTAITADQAAMMMLLLKVARTSPEKPTRDTIVDIAGYAAVYARVIGEDA